MAATEIFPRVFELKLGSVNAWLIRDDDGLTLIDTGYSGMQQLILDGMHALGHGPGDLKRILLTHCHPDHAGGLAALKQASGATVSAHARDAAVVRGDVPISKGSPSPGLLNQLLFRLLIKGKSGVTAPAQVEHELADGDLLPIGGGLRVLHTPGHSAGHLSFLLERDGGLLFAGDVCSNLPKLGFSIVYDDHSIARSTLRRLATLHASAICFGHGSVLRDAGAFARKWG